MENKVLVLNKIDGGSKRYTIVSHENGRRQATVVDGSEGGLKATSGTKKKKNKIPPVKK